MHHCKIHFSELSNAYVRAIRGEEIVTRRSNSAKVRELVPRWKRGGSFTGIKAEEMVSYIQHGYRVPGLQLVPPLQPVRNRRKMYLNDLDGDFQYDLWKSGEDLFFVDFTPREAIPSMNFQFCFNFAASVNEQTISAYQSWLLKAIIALEDSGIDCGISAIGRVDRMLNRNLPLEMEIEVKRAGEPLDFVLWSAMFAPSSFRHLGFLGYVLASEKLGYDASHSLGTNIPTKGFYCNFNSETRSVVANCAATGNSNFIEEEMTASFRAALEDAKRY